MRTLALLVGVHAFLRRQPKEEMPPGMAGTVTAVVAGGKEEAGPPGSAGEAAIIADGFSRVACIIDGSPEAVRVPYDDGGMRRPRMSPTECFTWCRDKAGMRFFLIEHGRDCYCTEYYHDITTGGGNCDLPCEGDYNEMCGGQVKASAFEMHMCGKGASRADAAAESCHAEADKAAMAAADGTAAFEAFQTIQTQWQLGVCSKSAQVCDLAAHWQDAAQSVRDAAHRADAAGQDAEEAAEAVEAAKAAGFNTAQLATDLEMAIDAAGEASRGAAVKSGAVGLALKAVSGALNATQPTKDVMTLFETASTRDEWHAVCNLEPLEGKKYMLASAEPVDGFALCADVCVALLDECVGFNYQNVTGAVACQMLSKTGVYTPQGSLSDAFGIFEVSETQVGNLGYDRIDCFLKAAFLARNGGVKPEVLATVIKTAETTTATTTRDPGLDLPPPTAEQIAAGR